MIQVNENNRILGREIHSKIESKNKNYQNWLKRVLEYADLQEGKDFFTKLLKSTGGRPETIYEFTLDAAKEICLLERNKKGKEIRKWLIELSNKKEKLELVTIKEAAFAFKVINCLKYIDNQKEAYSLHQKTFIENHSDLSETKYLYSEFAKYRAKLTGWDKEKTINAINDFLNKNIGYPKAKVLKSNMQTQLSIIDISEAIRIAVMDILYSKRENIEMIENFSNLCKNLAKEMELKLELKNNSNLFRTQENIETVKQISIQ